MPRPSYTKTAFAPLKGVDFDQARGVILDYAAANKVPVLDDTGDGVTVAPDHGRIGVRVRAGATQVFAEAQDDRWLFNMKNTALLQVKKIGPDVAGNLRWSDAASAAVYPPTLSFVTVQDVFPLGRAFLRVVLKGDDFSAYGTESIHFRLIQPKKDLPPAWPTLAPNGSVKWSDGDDAPHRPVYTARAIDLDAGTLTVDIFLHEGGQTIEWARDIMAGDLGRANVAIMGPMGGGLITDETVILAADETGLPAAARILENLPRTATGVFFAETDEGQGADYPLDVPNGVEVKWLSRTAGDQLGQALMDALRTPTDAAVWFAGERGQAARARDFAKQAGWNPKDLRISGFWKDDQ